MRLSGMTDASDHVVMVVYVVAMFGMYGMLVTVVHFTP
jgi:hypothetical protein